MKKLSEIGREMWVVDEHTDKSKFLHLRLAPNPIYGADSSMVLMTPEERRELIMRVWESKGIGFRCDNYQACEGHLESDITLKEFLDKEGL